jgi:hypothetical protein
MTHDTTRPVRSLVLAVVMTGPTAAAAAAFIGPETCKACHPYAYEAWRGSAHARAQEALPEPQRKEARCTSCHAPEAGAGASVAAVSCETCHGPGELYSARYVMRDAELARAVGLQEQGERRCLACHTDSAPSLLPFDYRKKLALIEHWKGERSWTRKRGGAARETR